MKCKDVKNIGTKFIYYVGNYFWSSELRGREHYSCISDFHNAPMKCFDNDITWAFTTEERYEVIGE